jgi:hypothetical protein
VKDVVGRLESIHVVKMANKSICLDSNRKGAIRQSRDSMGSSAALVLIEFYRWCDNMTDNSESTNKTYMRLAFARTRPEAQVS